MIGEIVMQYDKNNVFYKIINKEIETNIVLEGDHFIAINDIVPKAPVHVLVITKGEYVDFADFAKNASDAEIVDVNKAIAKLIDMLHLKEGGYKLVSNSGKFGMQEVMHAHIHILGKPAE